MVVIAKPCLSSLVAAHYGLIGTAVGQQSIGHRGCRRNSYPVGPGKVVVAAVADAVEPVVIGEPVVGAGRNEARGPPTSVAELTVGREHIVDHFLAKHEDRVGIVGKSGVLSYVGKYVEEVAFVGTDHDLGKLPVVGGAGNRSLPVSSLSYGREEQQQRY